MLHEREQASLIFGRRDFLRVGSGLAVSTFMSPAMNRATAAAARPSAATGGARSCILVYLLGGPPHMDMWDLKPHAPAVMRGPFQPIATNVPGVQICEHLPRLAQMADRYSLVRSVSHNNHNHGPMMYYTLTGHDLDQPNIDNVIVPPKRTNFPHIGAVLSRFKPSPQGLPGYIAIPELAVRSSIDGQYKRARTVVQGNSAGFLGARYDPLGVNGPLGTEEAVPALALPRDIPPERLQRRAALLSVLEGRGPSFDRPETYSELRDQAVVLTGAGSKSAQAFSFDAEPAEVCDRYGRNRLGRALLLSRRLAEVGVPMIAVHFNNMTVCDGWDTHSGNFTALKDELLPMLDRALSALLDDLRQRGLIDQTLVVVMGEFGRTPKINVNAGRDHWGSCQTVLMAGGCIKGGRVHGASDKLAAFPSRDPVDPVDLQATIYHAMGLDPHLVIQDHLGRPFPLSSGRILRELI